MLTLEELKKYLEKEREDLIELREKKDLTDEGKGQLEMINAIFQKMVWEIKEEENRDNKTKDLNNHYLLKDNGNNKSNNNGDSKKSKERD